MRSGAAGILFVASVLAVAGCGEYGRTVVVAPADDPAPPRALGARYFAGTVHLTWELSPRWNGETFRVYGKRASDVDYARIAEVTSCTDGFCTYADVNVRGGFFYHYYVSAVSRAGGVEAASEAVEVRVPVPVPPTPPGGLEAVAMDGAAYLRWGTESRGAEDFSHYRVYLADPDGTDFLLGETDSEGFLDERAENGRTSAYFVTALDDRGHESAGSPLARATPRPDFHEEWLYAYQDRPEDAGFRFVPDPETVPVVDGDDPGRHFRLEVDADGWWLVPGPGVGVFPEVFHTTALRCGPGADPGCTEVTVAPTGGYVSGALELIPRTTYVLRVPGGDGALRYGAFRVEMLGADGAGDAVMVFAWAYQLQAGNPSLTPSTVRVRWRGPGP